MESIISERKGAFIFMKGSRAPLIPKADVGNRRRINNNGRPKNSEMTFQDVDVDRTHNINIIR